MARVSSYSGDLEHIGYDDVDVTDLLGTGIMSIGEFDRAGIWPPDPTKAPRTSARLLWAGARRVQSKVLAPDSNKHWS